MARLAGYGFRRSTMEDSRWDWLPEKASNWMVWWLLDDTFVIHSCLSYMILGLQYGLES